MDNLLQDNPNIDGAMPTITQWAKDLGVIFSELKGNMEWIDSKIESQASEQRFRELIQEALQTRISEQTCRELIQEARQAEKDMIHRLVHAAIRNKWRTQGLSFQADLSMLQEKITGLQLSVSQCLKNHGGGQEKGNQKKQDPESPLAREPPSALTRPSNRERIVALEAENLQVIHEPILPAGYTSNSPRHHVGLASAFAC